MSTDSDAIEITAEDVVARGRESFSLRELAGMFHCSVEHLFRLATDGELGVTKEEIARAKSHSTIRVKRAALVDFLHRRTARPKQADKRTATAESPSHRKRRRKT